MKEIDKLNFRPFTRFCMSIGAVPSSYLAGLTIEEQLLWLCSYLEKEVIPAVNNNAEAVEELQSLFTELHDYVEHYFDNLDVQEEINNKLDDLVEDGTLTTLIGAYIQPRIDAQNEVINNFKNETNTSINNFKDDTNDAINDFETSTINTLNSFNNRLTSLTNQNPIPVNSTDLMTDTTKVYLLTTNGYWYYYDNNEWTQGGVYQSTDIGDKAVDIINLDTKLQANFLKDYTLETGSHYTNYYCTVNASNELEKTENNNYAYDKYTLTNQEIYLVTGGFNHYSCVGIIVADSDGNVIYSTKPESTSGNATTQSLFFKANQENLYLYVSYEQAVTTNYRRLNYHQVYKLTSLFLQDNFSSAPDLLYTYEDTYYNGVSDTMASNNGSKIRAYNMQKGRNYTLTAQNRYALSGIAICSYDQNTVLYKSNSENIGGTATTSSYTFTASQDGIILLSTYTDSSLYSITVNQNITEENLLANKTISCDGDSIMKGSENNNVSYYTLIATQLGMEIGTNNAVGGATIATGTTSGGTDRHWISSGVENISTSSDYILINGGVNDYYNNVALGEITNTFTDAIDSTTFTGGMELLCRNLLNRFTTGQKILFVFNHNINNIWYTNNSIDLTFKDYYDTQIAVLKKYGIPYLDLIHESQFNTILTTYKNSYTCDSDGVHPNDNGYGKFYVDKIIAKMKTL